MGEKPYKKMNELVYVLCVESVVFAAVSITIVAQRLNVFDWPEASTWPVIGTTIQIILLYSLIILLIMCFVHANRFNDFVIETCQACAKTIGRLMSVIVIFTASMCALVWLYDKVDWAFILSILGIFVCHIFQSWPCSLVLDLQCILGNTFTFICYSGRITNDCGILIKKCG